MKTVLIIDDEDKIVRFYKNYLETEGYEVLTAKNASEGTFMMIQWAEKIDLILLDINMPKIDGKYMSEVIQQFNPKMKVIVFSVRSLHEQSRAIPSAVDYFDKSQSVDVLLKKIVAVLGDEDDVPKEPTGSESVDAHYHLN
jgi:DNA-binding response OmpR family regulator